MKQSFFKTQYFDSRFGMVVLAPLLSISNFVLLSYNFTKISDILPLRYFAPAFIAIFIVSVILVGKTFRKHQLSTDSALAYEQNKEDLKTNLLILECLAVMHHNDLRPRLDERISYLKGILKI